MKAIGYYNKSLTNQVALISKNGRSFNIEFLGVEKDLPPVNKEILKVVGFDDNFFIRRLKLPLKKTQSLDKILPFQIENLTPYTIDELIVKRVYIKQEQKTDGILFIVPKKNFEQFLQKNQDLELDFEWVSLIPTALFRFAQFVLPSESSLIVFHTAEVTTQITIIKDEVVVDHLTISIGEKHFLDACKLDGINNLFHINEKKNTNVVSLLNRYKCQVDRIFSYFNYKKEPVCRVLFSGLLGDFIEKLIVKNFGVAPLPIPDFEKYDVEELRLYAVSIGLSLDALINDKKSIQLRQGQYLSKKCYKKMKKGLVKGGVFSGVFFTLSLFLSLFFLKSNRDELSQQIDVLISEYEDQIPSLKKIKFVKGIKEKLREVHSKLNFSEHCEEYFDTPPLVNDLLLFIEQYPKIESLELVSIEYELGSFPTLNEPKKQYNPKASIVFKADDAKQARAFHDAIIDDQKLINTNYEIEWNRRGNEYEITFHIKV